MGKSNPLINLTFLLHQSLGNKNGLTRFSIWKSNSRSGNLGRAGETWKLPKIFSKDTGGDRRSNVGRRRELSRALRSHVGQRRWERGLGYFVWIFTVGENMDGKVSSPEVWR
ncbi:hypothetical protein Adt_37287 [Abeliophyllum distichum]|uniref:Uncharacterized protein n=1 Tax=Abeliophyllum distichum TaxID=126358 RepID=A0ABD1QKH0_9LAMI